MQNIHQRPAQVVPTGIQPYFDKLQIWVLQPLDHQALARLRTQCGKGGIYVDNRPARFDARYRQRIELRQPSDQALRWLARRDDALINRAEIAIDYVFRNGAARDDAWDFLHRHLIRRWHGKKQQIRIYRADGAYDLTGVGTRYDGGGWVPNKIVFYRDDHCRITGEVSCLHLEWRVNGLRAVRAAGIKSGRDLLEFNHRQFWQKRLLLYDIDKKRLGRLIRNQVTGKKSRTSVIKQSSRYSVDIDGRTGEVHARAHDTIQQLIDQLKGSHRLSRALVSISSVRLLPE